MISWGNAASQQTYFIVSSTPSNAMLEEGDQNTILGIKSCVVNAASQQTYFTVSGSPSNTMLGGDDQNTMLRM